MLRSYAWKSNQLVPADLSESTETPLVWIDLLNPTPEETSQVERHLGIVLPSRDEMEEIELSDRLYNEDDAEFLTFTALSQVETESPIKTPITFVLKNATLLSLRHSEPRPFRVFQVRSQRPGMISSSTGERTMLGIIEAVVDRMADTLERVSDDIDQLSADIFRSKQSNVTKKTRNLQSLIERIGREGDLLSMVRESLVSINRLAAYHAVQPLTDREAKQRIKLLQRDVVSLTEHSAFMSQKINFLLDATMGLINLEQTQIIKIFSVAAVALLPPTLIASIYGMNFDHMPELSWQFGYPFALVLMLLSSLLPFLFFKRRGWL